MSEREDESRLVQIFNGDMWQAELIHGLLASNNIECMIKDDSLSAVASPYMPVGGEVCILVNESDEERAREIIENSATPEQ